MKHNKIITLFAVATLVLASACKKDTYKETLVDCPIVVSTTPPDQATNVPTDQVISVKFNKELEAETINAASISVDGVSGTVSYSGVTATFTPSAPLKANSTFIGKVKTSVKDVQGNALQEDYLWTFSTAATISPTVVSVSPTNNSTGVALNQTLVATFNMAMTPASLNTSTFTVKQGGNTIGGTISYNGNKASFNPTSNFSTNTKYTATITTGAKNTLGEGIANNYVWAFTTGTVTAPTVTAVNPANNGVNVPFNSNVTATFSEPMASASIDGTSFLLMDGATVVNGTVTYNGLKATFNPSSSLDPNKVYSATITTDAENMAGTGLATNYKWSFTTGTVAAPTVTETSPVNNAVNVALNTNVTATFSENMKASTIDGSSFLLKDGASAVSGTVTYNGLTATFNPSSSLDPNKVYSATITTNAENMAGTGLATNYSWSFTTGTVVAPTVTVTSPVNNAENVALNTNVTATFSENMEASTINGSSFLLKDGASAVNGVVTYNGQKATFNPSSDLDPSTVYSATITTDAENMAGISLVNKYEWSFTTSANTTFNPTIDLNSVGRFGIISGVGVSNNAGPSEINNLDVGIYPGVRSSITGFFEVDGGPGLINNGAFYASDDAAPVPAMLLQAKDDLTSAYLDAEGANSPAPATVSGDIGGQTLPPGIYKSTSTLSIQNGNLTLDGQGDPNAEWIFQIASDFTTVGSAPFPSPAGGNVILTGGAKANNVTWQVGSSATIGDYTSFKGNILALTSVTMNGFSQATGRMLCSNGAVTLTSTNTINKP